MATQPDARRKRKSLGAPITANNTMENPRRKGSRSKSIGPGGLDALQKTSGNRRASLATPLIQPRSILKYTPSVSSANENRNPIGLDLRDNMTVTGAESLANPSSDPNRPGSKIALRTEEEQQAAAKEREERERKDARRKSLGANRRVSFAAEATLYTFHEIEFPQESTASSGSTGRASSATQQQPPSSSGGEGRIDNRNPQGVNRRSSGHPQADLDISDENTVGSSAYSSDSDAGDAVEEVEDDEDDGMSSDSSDSDSDDGTMVTIEGDEVTSASVASGADESTLDEALRLAAQHAGTQRLGSDDDADEGEEVIPSFGWIKKAPAQAAPSQVQAASQSTPNDKEADATMDMDMDMDMDITRAGGRILQSKQQANPDNEADISMDVTKALGRIMGQNRPNATKDTSPSTLEDATMDFTTAAGRVHHAAANDETFHDDEDMSMELTTAIGAILGAKRPAVQSWRQTMAHSDQTVNVEQDMDMTVSAGRILSSQPAGGGSGGYSEEETAMDIDMDMTIAAGRVLPIGPPTQTAELADDEVTMGMDMTLAVGKVLNPQPESRLTAKSMLKEEVNIPDSPSKSQTTPGSPVRHQTTVTAPASTGETDSPAAFRGKGLRRSLPAAAPEPSADIPETTTEAALPSKQTSPQKQVPASKQRGSTPNRASSPAKASTPKRARSPAKASTPKRAASPAKVSAPRRAASPAKSSTPKRATHPETLQRKTPERENSEPDVSKGNSLFVDDPKTGSKTPTVVLTPQRRQLSGLGVDREGLGSPRVSALLDRRISIGESSETFSPGKAANKRRVVFDDPRAIEKEVERERNEEEAKELRRRILEREANGEQESTLNLKEMIASLSPKRNPLRGRKSLHVGSAQGILGKRPSELDDSDEENDGVKRLKGHQGSPVKNVRLQQPPSKAETTTGRLTRPGKVPDQDKENVTPPPNESSEDRATTSGGQGNFGNFGDDTMTRTVSFDDLPIRNEVPRNGDDADGRIHLQDFLSMISVRFMELTTSKRRQTQMPAALPDGEDDMSLERCVVAGACTVPMLELYQHSCRELKKYISEGRRIVKEIEGETFEENPPLFREYASATPDFKMLMDNQFKNVKTHARLLSKAMWYEWRMKLQDGLKEGLVRIAEGMDEDAESLERQQKLLDSVLPDVLARYETLSKEHANLETYAQELAECDPEELQGARDELVSVGDDIEAKKKAIAELRRELEDTELEIEKASVKKQECLDEIKEAEKIREECRGWSTTEINLHKARVEALEKKHGWAVTGVLGTQISLCYKRAIEVVFDVTSFKPDQDNSSIDVWYVATNSHGTPRPATAELEFFLQLIRDHVRSVPQSRTKISRMLHMVGAGWDLAAKVANDIRLVNVTFPTKVVKTSDSSIAVVSSLMMVPLATRVEVTLNIRGAVGHGGVEVAVEPEAKVCYGESFNVGKITEFLSGRIGSSRERGDGGESWSDVFVSLHEKLLARGQK
ncbi:related to spindle pole body protein [Cephalotrichum gorgonifer]|uniref:Related to spindle pole body protein n=1 Tax=Cephalotrichum gorgonifer TaxID=2041049 RepID=A0AAE8N8P7_9PEZI|nr:related to spindle pole body protein [Cephalotrichum gorgonifer]